MTLPFDDWQHTIEANKQVCHHYKGDDKSRCHGYALIDNGDKESGLSHRELKWGMPM
jgi:hypothetical protein